MNDKPGIFREWTDAVLVVVALILSMAVALVIAIAALKNPGVAARIVFSGGLVGVGALMCAEFWRGERPSKLFGVLFFALILALVILGVA